MDSPPTAWTAILKAKDRTHPAHRVSIAKLVELYDGPLDSLFRQRLRGTLKAYAQDWKQDFVISHLLSGRIFAGADPSRSFRRFLATAANNYLRDKVSSYDAKKNSLHRLGEGQAGEAMEGVAQTLRELADPRSIETGEKLLTGHRAEACFKAASQMLLDWCGRDKARRQQAELLIHPSTTRDQICGPDFRPLKIKFRTFLFQCLREELSADDEAALERDASELLDIFYEAWTSAQREAVPDE